MKAVPRSNARASRSITLKPATPTRWQRVASLKDGPMRLLVAARIGRTRLIDNVAVSRGRTAKDAKRRTG